MNGFYVTNGYSENYSFQPSRKSEQLAIYGGEMNSGFSPSSIISSAFPRSASEASLDSSCSKYRQLPCRTFISVGSCPYRERCVYLHDPRCISRDAKTKTRRKNKEDLILDAFFWPMMPYAMLCGKQDMNGQPHVIQPYAVPLPQNDHYQGHDRALYSLWMHFVDFCITNSSEKYHEVPYTERMNVSAYEFNQYTKLPRLKIFMQLSNFNAILKDEMMMDSFAFNAKVKMNQTSSVSAFVPFNPHEKANAHESSLFYRTMEANRRQDFKKIQPLTMMQVEDSFDPPVAHLQNYSIPYHGPHPPSFDESHFESEEHPRNWLRESTSVIGDKIQPSIHPHGGGGVMEDDLDIWLGGVDPFGASHSMHGNDTSIMGQDPLDDIVHQKSSIGSSNDPLKDYLDSVRLLNATHSNNITSPITVAEQYIPCDHPSLNDLDDEVLLTNHRYPIENDFDGFNLGHFDEIDDFDYFLRSVELDNVEFNKKMTEGLFNTCGDYKTFPTRSDSTTSEMTHLPDWSLPIHSEQLNEVIWVNSPTTDEPIKYYHNIFTPSFGKPLDA